jgi:hypothetical protein
VVRKQTWSPHKRRLRVEEFERVVDIDLPSKSNIGHFSISTNERIEGWYKRLTNAQRQTNSNGSCCLVEECQPKGNHKGLEGSERKSLPHGVNFDSC